MKTGYSIVTGGVVALTAATPRSVLGVKGNAAFGVDLIGYEISLDGVTAANVGVLVELCYATFATNSPGTNSTSVTPAQAYGRPTTHGFTAAKAWTAGNEPTVLTVIREYLLTPNAGLVIERLPRDRTPDSALAEGFVFRLTAPNNVNCRAMMAFERA